MVVFGVRLSGPADRYVERLVSDDTFKIYFKGVGQYRYHVGKHYLVLSLRNPFPRLWPVALIGFGLHFVILGWLSWWLLVPAIILLAEFFHTAWFFYIVLCLGLRRYKVRARLLRRSELLDMLFW